MFTRLHKTNSERYGEKFHFRFSHFQALQVPKGWDKLVLSIVLVETGKMVAKSSKAPVRNGNCGWIEKFSESIWIQQDDASKETDKCFIKLIVTTGSSRSDILGEASVNLASYLSSKTSVPITLPLKKCNSGTNLQLRVQCLTPRAKIRDKQWKDTNSDMEDVNFDNDEMENKSDASDGTFTRSVGSSSGIHLDTASHIGEQSSRNMSFSPSGSRNSFDSVEGSFGRENYSPLSYLSDVKHNLIGRQDLVGSQCNYPHNSYSFNDASGSNKSLFNPKVSNQREEFNRVPHAVASSPFQNAACKDLLEAAEATIEELRAEARMWEQNAQKLMTDMDKIQQESLDQSRHQASLEIELSESLVQCDGMKQEIEQLKKLVEESQMKNFQTKDMDSDKNELEDEIKFQKQMNANMAVQLRKTQESNIELLSILQEMEETIEKQKREIDYLSKLKSEFEVGVQGLGFGGRKKTTVEHPRRDLTTEIEQEDYRNRGLEVLQLHLAQNNLESTIQHLDKSPEDGNNEIEMGRDSQMQILMHHEAEWRKTVAEKEENIVKLEAKLFEALSGKKLKEKDDQDLSEEVDVLKKRLLELERDYHELTDENLELMFKLEESRKDNLSNGIPSHECPDNNSVFKSESEFYQLKFQLHKLEEELKEKNVLVERLSTKANKSDDLEHQLQAFRDRASYFDGSLCKSRFRAQECENEIGTLRKQLEHEMQIHMHELEEENVQLSERISGLEAQLRYFTNERESSRLELENSAAHAMSLQDEIRRLEAKMQAQKVEMKQKLQEMKRRWLGVQEECEYLKIANPKLQSTAESLIEECSLLQKSNAELRKQKMNLHEHCAIVEAQLGESEKSFSNLSLKVEALEENYLSMMEEISSKEKALNFELDVLLDENRKHKDKLVLEESLINQMYLEKTVEVRNLQREVAHLTEQLSTTHDKKDGLDPEAVREVSHLREDKAVLEAALQEGQGKLKLSESKLETLKMESQTKIQHLTSELAAATQNQEILMADHENLLNLLEDVKSNEEKFRSTIRGLEVKLKTSEYERLQLEEEISSLKVQLESTALLQGDILSLKKSLNEAKFENERLEASFQMLSGDHEELKAERTSFMQKISISQQAVSELENCKHKKVALEEKVLRLEGDLAALEALGSQEAALKNDLAQIRRENSHFQRRIKCLEKEKEECVNRAQALEEELKQNKELLEQDVCGTVANLPHTDSNATSASTHDNPHPTLMEQGHSNLQVNEKPSTEITHPDQRQIDTEKKSERFQDMEMNLLSKIQYLENELAETLETSDMYKEQLKSLLSEELSSASDTSKTKKDGYEYDWEVSSLKAELKDLQEQYFQMSLKYAEVEAQRAQLVLKLKSTNGGRRWFS